MTFCSPVTGQCGDYDEYDPLLNGQSVTAPVAAAAIATTAAQVYAAPVEAVTPSAPVLTADTDLQQPVIDWQTALAFTRRSRLLHLSQKVTQLLSIRSTGNSRISRTRLMNPKLISSLNSL